MQTIKCQACKRTIATVAEGAIRRPITLVCSCGASRAIKPIVDKAKEAAYTAPMPA